MINGDDEMNVRQRRRRRRRKVEQLHEAKKKKETTKIRRNVFLSFSSKDQFVSRSNCDQASFNSTKINFANGSFGSPRS